MQLGNVMAFAYTCMFVAGFVFCIIGLFAMRDMNDKFGRVAIIVLVIYLAITCGVYFALAFNNLPRM